MQRSLSALSLTLLVLTLACTQKDGDDDFPWCIPDRDPGCECIEGSTRLCGASQLGTCRLGMQTCADGIWGACLMEVGPEDERCDGLDNDCDGETDEDLEAQPCENQVGVCSGSVASCLGAQGWGTCTADDYGIVYRQDEDGQADSDQCDGLDNDCDGVTDEGCACEHQQTRTCSSDTGTCVEGVQTCENGSWGECVGGILPKDELCDGLDNDCDGVNDNHLTAPPCALHQGLCSGSVQTCGGAEGWRPCDASSYPAGYVTEELPTSENWLCNGVDDDCDGVVDEGCECTIDDQRSCGITDEGACRLGTQFCIAGFWDACSGAQDPVEELCDGIDNDCDGEYDELWPTLGNACGAGVCGGGTLVCSSDGAEPVCSTDFLAEPETCDGRDNDCNGLIDDLSDDSCYSGPSSTRGVGICHDGLRHCAGGYWGPCQGEVLPAAEICDGLDNDCDGLIDNHVAETGHSCVTGIPGVCMTGYLSCQEGELRCVQATYPVPEICGNDLDDDCDGLVDDCY